MESGDDRENPQAALELLVLKTLARGPNHGFGIALHIETTSSDLLRVEEGSLYPALHRLETRAVHGRLIQPHDEPPDAAPVALLMYETWMTRFGGDPSIVGTTVPMGEPWERFYERGGPALDPDAIEAPSYTVIGVAAPIDPTLFEPAAAVIAWNAETDQSPLRRVRFGQDLTVVGRLAPGATLAQGQAELEAIGTALREQHPRIGNLMPRAVRVYDVTVSSVRPTLLALFGATGFVLLIAISNIANLQLARATARRGELSVRAALGATRRRLVRLLLTESLALSFAATLAGVALACH